MRELHWHDDGISKSSLIYVLAFEQALQSRQSCAVSSLDRMRSSPLDPFHPYFDEAEKEFLLWCRLDSKSW